MHQQHSACLCVVCKSLSRVWLFCDPMDCSLPDFSVHGILQARILQWVPIPFPQTPAWWGAKPCSWVIMWKTKEKFHVPCKTPYNENMSKKSQRRSLNSRSPLLPLQSWPTSGLKFRKTNSFFRKGSTQNTWFWWEA